VASKTFTYAEAVALLPEVRRLTQAAHGRVEALRVKAGSPESPDAEEQVARIVAEWARAIEALGVEVKGPWLVDFDSGSGYYCWLYPEPGLHHFHDYDAGFRGRMPIQ